MAIRLRGLPKMINEQQFDQVAFFDIVRKELFNGSMTQDQVEGLARIAKTCAVAALNPLVEQSAYVLATVFHETAQMMQPIEEYYGSTTRYAPWYGRGDVMITWESNYRKQEEKMSCLLEADRPEKWEVHKHMEYALDPVTSAFICVHGMQDGDFTGKCLSDYINKDVVDYPNCRKVVNGTDKMDMIAEYARIFERALFAGFEGMEIPKPEPAMLKPFPVKVQRVLVGTAINERHPDVKVAQALFAGRGFNVGVMDGVAGPIFTSCVLEFQAKYGLVQDGVIGVDTWTELEKSSVV